MFCKGCRIATRIITRTRLRDHITPVLQDLHWLPIRQRIDYKTILYTFKILNGLAPTYLGSLITPYQPKGQLRSLSKFVSETQSYDKK